MFEAQVAHGSPAGFEYLRSVRARTSLPGSAVADPAFTPALAKSELALGYRSYGLSKFEEAITQITATFERLKQNPLTAAHPTLREATDKAWVALIDSLRRTKKRPEAELRMTEFMIGDLARNSRFDLSPYGADLVALQAQVLKRLDREARGTLAVVVSEPRAEVYLNERSVGRGASYTESLVPGEYRVLIVVDKQALRYDVVIVAGARRDLDVDWSLDTTYRFDDRFFGLITPGGVQPCRDRPACVMRIGRAVHHTASEIQFWSLENRPGTPIFVGRRYSAETGRIVRVGWLAADDATQRQVSALVGWIDRGLEPWPTSRVSLDEPTTSLARPSTDAKSPEPRARASAAPLVFTLVGLAITCAGGWLIYDDDGGTPSLPGIGLAALGGSAMLIGGAWYLGSRFSPGPSPSAASDRTRASRASQEHVLEFNVSLEKRF